MKHKKLLFGFFLLIVSFGRLYGVAEVWDVSVQGPLTSRTVDGDLVVVNGPVCIMSGDLIVNGDLKVTDGYVRVCGGNLEVNGDLIVTNRTDSEDAFIFVQGDLLVTGAVITRTNNGHAYIDVRSYWVSPDGYVGGNIEVGRISTWGYLDAYVIADSHITVPGAIMTRSIDGHAFVSSRGQVGYTVFVGDINAGAIFTFAISVPDDEPDLNDLCTDPCPTMGIRNGPGTPTGAIVRADNGHIFVTGPIVTYARSRYALGYERFRLESARFVSYTANAYVLAEGNIEAAAITTFADGGDAYVSAEKITVNGDIRTEARAVEDLRSTRENGYFGGDAHVKARPSGLPESGTFEDIIAQNIYTKGVAYDGFGCCSAYVQAYRHIEVIGDIVTFESFPEGENGFGDSAYVRAGFGGEFSHKGNRDVDATGHIKAQNVMTKSPSDADVTAYTGIDVTGEIITESEYGYGNVYTEYESIRAGNIATVGGCDASVHSADGDVDVAHVISTKYTNNCSLASREGVEIPPDYGAFVYTENGSIKAEKIFTDGGYADGSVLTGGFTGPGVDLGVRFPVVDAGNEIRVKGPIVTKSSDGAAAVGAANDIYAGAISTDAEGAAWVLSENKSINVVEDIRTKSAHDSASVQAPLGDIHARSIRTESGDCELLGRPVCEDDSIIAAPGSGKFTFVPNLQNNTDITIENCEFDLDSDHDWSVRLHLKGTCTLNGKGHALNFVEGGKIIIEPGAGLYLQNIVLKNVKNDVVECESFTATLSVHNVTFMQSGDYTFWNGQLAIIGDFRVQGPETKFIYRSWEQWTINKNSQIFFDRDVTFVFDRASFSREPQARALTDPLQNRIVMADASSRLHFNDATLDAVRDLRLKRGTLVFDNTVTFSARDGEMIAFGDNSNASNNINFEFHEASKLLFDDGFLLNQNV